MRTVPHPEDPDPGGAARVRPYLRSAQPGVRTRRLHPPAGRSEPGSGGQVASLRPFVITAGRVSTPDPDIGVETQVTVHPGATATRLPPEQRAIVGLCERPMSVAEISATLRMHLEVTRILVGDLRA
ncbi:MAG TPA: DUF742 domain-containing protein, partial [Actinoplanes sp.]|nr:DUF742 domain-containing protein [Actinoplanes sp.]